MARQETSSFILFIGELPFIYHILFINELKGGTLGTSPIINIEFFGEIEYIRKLKDSHCLKILTETHLIISCNVWKIFILKG